MRMRVPALVALLMGAAAMSLSTEGFSVTIYWVNLGEGVWNEPTNWSRGSIPGNDEARIGNGGTVLIDDSQTVTTGFAIMGDTNLARGTLRMTGGSLSTT